MSVTLSLFLSANSFFTRLFYFSVCQLEVHMLEKLSVQFAQILGNGDQTLFFQGFTLHFVLL